MHDVARPDAGPGEVVVSIERAGVCGTDVDIFTGRMSYLHSGQAWYPIRPGHEWAGVVSAVGDGVAGSWLGRRVTGDTMLGCGHCARCLAGRQHVCADRYEIGIRNGWPGALAEQMPIPVTALQPLPDAVGPALGALVEPGGTALRCVQAADLQPDDRLLIMGPGAIGLLAAQIAAAQGAEVHLLGRTARSLALPAASASSTRGPAGRCPACGTTLSSMPPMTLPCPRSPPVSWSQAAGWCTSDSPTTRAALTPAPWC